MLLDVNTLLSGPRGRRLCLEFALPRSSQDTPEHATLWELLFYSTHRLELARGQAGQLFGPGAAEPLPDPSVADVAAVLDNVSLEAVDDLNGLLALAATVDSARYWQEPDGTNELLLAPGMESA